MARLIDQISDHQRPVWDKLIAQVQGHRLAHAMAFCGGSDDVKKEMAYAFAQALLCDSGGMPCGECGACKRVTARASESILFIEPESSTIKIEWASQVLEFLALQRLGRARVVIIDQAQLLNLQTANALLKAIEEPPPETFFILIAPEPSLLLPTIRSRVQAVRFLPQQKAEGEASEFRQLSLEFLNEASQNTRTALEKLQAEAKDKETALNCARTLQQVLRDWTVNQSLGSLPEVADSKKTELWREAFQMELDILAHVDRNLIFENFYYRVRHVFN